MTRRLVALVLAAILFVANVAALDCAGWQASASERMSCCAKAEHSCPDQVAADQCCAAGELAQQPEVATSVAAAPAVSMAALAPVLVRPSRVPTFRTLSNHPQSPPHFRRTVLLI